MFTANAYKHKLDNKDKAVVLGVSGKAVRMRLVESGAEKTISLDDPAMRFVKHAWAGTNHAAQGKSVTGVIAAMAAHERMTDQSSFYVAISRFKNNVKLFTDDKDQLRTVLKLRTAKPEHALAPSEIKGFKSEMQKTEKVAEKTAERERVLVKTRTQDRDFGR